MEIEKIIDEFKELDLSKYPDDQIKNLIKKVGPIGYVIVTFHKGKIVMRARPNSNEERFSNRADFSFKPAEYNKTYQRASTPNQTMFYATVIPDRIEKGELDNMRIIGITETLPFLRDKASSGYQKISFGKWEVQEEINLLAIVHKDDYYKESNFTRELVDSYKRFISRFPKEVVDKSVAFQTYLSNEFSKKEIKRDYDYMISAIFSEMAINNGVDGIYYPSVRTDGKGFNIAIKPESVEKLKLVVAGECSLYKLRDHVVVGNDAITEIKDDKKSFEMKDIVPNSREICLAKLGVKSIDDLNV